ncbi:MAG: undecaprenyl/decaprenyl-phosphate alpha-N-acetylglucosaminyl 1-phosphate transferase, partial [Bacteroidaceae bacterium]|nr:undecaprenyl/decaprenyl-phosphate alpha-N-acetylglucosaminyl 1-phosphate transferase [Bacteroidaceae bacterium]
MQTGIIFVTFLISLLAGVTITPWLVKLCMRMGWTDIPNHRKVHTQPVPRLGGLIFLPCTAISFIVAQLIINNIEQNDFTIHFSTVCMVLGAMSIYLVGLIDDIRELKANTKFLVQLVAALI